jgi:hypothetical protein
VSCIFSRTPGATDVLPEGEYLEWPQLKPTDSLALEPFGPEDAARAFDPSRVGETVGITILPVQSLKEIISAYEEVIG